MSIIKVIVFLFILTVGCIAETDGQIITSDLPKDCYPVVEYVWGVTDSKIHLTNCIY